MNTSKKWLEITIVLLLGAVLLSFDKITIRNTDLINQNKTHKWVLEWKEDFTGTSLDTTVWGYMARQKSGSWKYHSTHPENYEIRNGILTLKGFKNDGSITDTAAFLTGGIYTKAKKSFAPGKFEVRARIKSAYGGTAAIWLMPFNPEKGWPADGEIDIMEHAKNFSSISQTVHTSYTKAKDSALPNRVARVKVNPGDFNTYSVEIFNDSLVFYVNHSKSLVYPKIDSLKSAGQFPFFRDWYVLLNVNLNIWDNDSINHQELPIEMSVDWVKYYKLMK